MAQKIKKKANQKKTDPPAKRTARKRTGGKSTPRARATSAKRKTETSRKTKRTSPKSVKSKPKVAVKMDAKKKKSSAKSSITAPVQDNNTGLLRQTKTSTAALKHLEKGIELIFKKDFKKALLELNSLCSKYPEEAEIVARARSYIAICERENPSKAKIETSSEQLYALGVLEHNKAKYDEAISYYVRSLKDNPELDYIHYSIAASQAMKGDLKESLDNLRKAVDLNEESRIYARNDEDFSAFEGNEEFDELVGISQDQTTDSE